MVRGANAAHRVRASSTTSATRPRTSGCSRCWSGSRTDRPARLLPRCGRARLGWTRRWIAPGNVSRAAVRSARLSRPSVTHAEGRAATRRPVPVQFARRGVRQRHRRPPRTPRCGWRVAGSGTSGDQWRRYLQVRRRRSCPGTAVSPRACARQDRRRGDFLTCCFGFRRPGQARRSQCLSAWLRSALAADPRASARLRGRETAAASTGRRRCGRSQQDRAAHPRVRHHGLRRRRRTYQPLLSMRRTPRSSFAGVSRGESPRSALDRPTHGVPLIANASESRWRRFPIAQRSGCARTSKTTSRPRSSPLPAMMPRARLAKAGRKHVRNVHDPIASLRVFATRLSDSWRGRYSAPIRRSPGAVAIAADGNRTAARARIGTPQQRVSPSTCSRGGCPSWLTCRRQAPGSQDRD